MSSRIDGAGQAKLETLENALTQLQRVNAVVERMASAARLQQDTQAYRHQIQRSAAPLVGLLKQQFEAMSDMAAHLILVISRGGGDNARVRALREIVGQIKAQIEASMSRVRDQHAVQEDVAEPE